MKTKSGKQHCVSVLLLEEISPDTLKKGKNVDIPFKHSISSLVLWPHTPVCQSSMFIIPAESAERSEGNSAREAAWPHTPTPLRLQLEDRDEMWNGVWQPSGIQCGQGLSTVISALLTLGSPSPISDSFHFYPLDLEHKELVFRKDQKQLSSDAGPHVRAGRSFPLGPLLQSFPSLCHWRPSVDCRHTQHTQAAHTDSLGMQILSLSFLRGFRALLYSWLGNLWWRRGKKNWKSQK